MANSQKLANKNIDAKLKKQYKAVYKNIENELNKVWLEMVTSGNISSSNLLKANRYRELLKTLDLELRGLAKNQDRYTQESLMDTYIDAWNAMHEFIGVPKEFTILDKEVAKQVIFQNYKGATFSERIWTNTTDLKNRLVDEIALSAVAGTDVRKVAKNLQKTLNASYSDCKRMTITETSRVFNESCRITALNSGIAETYHLLLEANACERCTPYQGEHIPLTKSILPLHPYCKCTMIIDI